MITSSTLFTSITGVKKNNKNKKDKETKKIKPPSLKNPPLHLTSSGEKMWKKFWKDHLSDIRKILRNTQDPLKKWAAIVAFFRNYSLKRNIYPFDPNLSSQKEDTKSYIKVRFDKARNSLYKRTLSTLKVLKKVTTKISREKVFDVYYNDNTSKFFIASYVSVSLKPDFNFYGNEVRQVLKRKGFNKKTIILRKPGTRTQVRVDGYFFQTGTGSHYILATENETSDNKFDLILVMQFTRQQMALLIGDPKIDFSKKTDVKKLTNKVAKYFKSTLKKSKQIEIKSSSIIRLSTKELDKVSILSKISPQLRTLKDIDFSSNMNEKEKEYLVSTLNEAQSLSGQEIKNKFKFDAVLDLGTPIYQYNLIAGLIGILSDKKEEPPILWLSSLERPNFYFNPEYQDLFEKFQDENLS